MKKVIAALAAGGVLVTGAFVASVVSGATANAQTEATTTSDATDQDPWPRAWILDEVLAGLVDDGTLSQAQSDTVRDRFAAHVEDAMAERQLRREAAREMRDLIEGFLEDDVITADELSQLPEDHPLRDEDGVFADALADGQITRDELRQVGVQRRQVRRERRDAWLGLDT